MLKYIFTYMLLAIAAVAGAQPARSLSPTVKSPRVVLDDVWDAPAVMVLGSDDELQFSFDELSHIYHRYLYRIVHCNADWTPSGLPEIDYLEGFNGVPVEEWENSVNTTQLYTHYSFTLPNADVSLKLSGNYIVEVYEAESDDDSPVVMFEFSVVEPCVAIEAAVSGNTDISFNSVHQQLSFTVDYPSFVSSPASEIKPVVYQNRRRDTAVQGLVPTYVTSGRVEYVHNEKLIFNAGNEYRRFELVDPNSPGEGVEEVVYVKPHYNALLYVDKPRTSRSNYHDENGMSYINTLEGRGTEIEADYVYVHFALDVPYRDGGDYYLLGDFCNGLTPLTRLSYDAEGDYYFTARQLKLGLYNYMYAWLPHGATKVETVSTEGNFYETENEYLIYIYYRGFAERYDRLLGVHRINYSLESN